MVLIVHGFPNSTSALRFEWAWQNPDLSRRLKHVPKKKTRQKTFDYCLAVLSEMLQVGPWSRLPLTVRWLDDDFGRCYSSHVSPPLHMPITYGKVTSRKPKDAASKAERKKNYKSSGTEARLADASADELLLCSVCASSVDTEDRVVCVKPDCSLVSHLICLAGHFKKDDMILPVEGSCPVCDTNLLWGDLIRKKIGCNMHLDEEDSDSSDFNSD